MIRCNKCDAPIEVPYTCRVWFVLETMCPDMVYLRTKPYEQSAKRELGTGDLCACCQNKVSDRLLQLATEYGCSAEEKTETVTE